MQTSIRSQIRDAALGWLEQWTPEYAEFGFALAVLLWIGLVSLVIHVVLHRGLIGLLNKSNFFAADGWRRTLFDHKVFRRLALLLQSGIIFVQSALWLEHGTALLNVIQIAAEFCMLLFGLLAFFSLLDAGHAIFRRHPSMRQFPLKGILQTVKLVAAVFIIISMVALLMGRSPLILLSGLGALSAVLMLVFKDPILGLVSGIQLSANNMLAVGDWLEMPQFGADGDVIDISLTTVKVQNWDKTITTIPTYALISDSFKNWRGMSESGGRRIKRSLLLDTSSIRFLNESDLQRLSKAKLLSTYLQDTIAAINESNNQEAADLSSMVNGRRMTNIGTLRAYLVSYLKNHPQIHQDMTLLVRQLDPTPQGLPIQIYAFTNTVDWGEYEDIQADLFDHLFAVLPEFDLRAHEAPTGNDVRSLTV